ncbi:MAG: homocysteine S-methyltransferase family protein [Pirellulales bacterium]
MSCYPNADFPTLLGGFDETPEMMARALGEFAERGWLNIAGGCCGTTPAHIAAITRLSPTSPASPRSLNPIYGSAGSNR